MAYQNAGLYGSPILDRRGNSLPTASVQVNLVGGGAATVYTDRTKATPAANPITGTGTGSTIDANGNLFLYADPGLYDLDITAGGITTTVRIEVPIDPTEAAQDTDVSAHVNNLADAHDASAVSFVPAGSIAATDVQAAIEEVASEAGGSVAAHLADPTDAHDASSVSFIPSGSLAATDVQSALDEVALDYIAADAVLASNLAAHLTDTVDAHDASAISFIATGTIAATDVQAAIAEVSGDVTTISTTYLPLAGGTLTGALLFSPDNTVDIGASGATRPRTGYFGTSLAAGGAVLAAGTFYAATSGKALVARAAATTPGNVFELQTSTPANLMTVGPTGAFNMTNTARLTTLTVTQANSGGGNSATDSTLQLVGTSGTNNMLWLNSSTANWIVSSNGTGGTAVPLILGMGTGSAVYIDTSSRIGMGTSGFTPSARLQVQGAASEITAILRENATTPGVTLSIQNSDGTRTATFRHNVIKLGTSGQIVGDLQLEGTTSNPGGIKHGGTAGSVQVYSVSSGGAITIAPTTAVTWTFATALTTASTHLVFSGDNTYDIGASGATRPRTLYLGTSLISGNTGTTTTVASNNITQVGGGVTGSIGTTATGLSVGTSSSSDPLNLQNSGGKVGINASGVSGGLIAPLHIAQDTAPDNILTLQQANASGSAYIVFRKSRGTVASPTIVATGGEFGVIRWQAYDGASWINAATISVFGDTTTGGTPGLNDIPTGMFFAVTPDGGSVPVAVMRFDNAGRVVMGHKANYPAAGLIVDTHTAIFGTDDSSSNVGALLLHTSGSSNPTANRSQVVLSRSRGTHTTPTALTAAGDFVGDILWKGYDGTNNITGAGIRAFLDGTPGTNDMPMRLVFLTTPDGSATPAEALRITSLQQLIMSNGSNMPPAAETSYFTLAYDGAVASITSGSNTATTSGNLYFRRSRSNISTPAAVSVGDRIGDINYRAIGGTTWNLAAIIRVEVDAGTPTNTSMPGRILFLTTPDGSATPTEALRITSSQSVYAQQGIVAGGIVSTVERGVITVYGGTSQKGVVARAGLTTPGNLFEGQANDGTVVFAISPGGNASVTNTAGTIVTALTNSGGDGAAGTTSNTAFSLMTNGTRRWQVTTAGHLLAIGADNTYDFGASGATRARTGYFGTSLVVGSGARSMSLTTDSVSGVGPGTSSVGLDINVTTADYLRFMTSSSVKWQISPGGSLLTGTNNSWDIGASGASSPRNVYTGTAYYVGATKVIGAQGAAVSDAAAIGTYVGIDGVDRAALITTLTDLRTQMNLILARIRAATGHGLIA